MRWDTDASDKVGKTHKQIDMRWWNNQEELLNLTLHVLVSAGCSTNVSGPQNLVNPCLDWRTPKNSVLRTRNSSQGINLAVRRFIIHALSISFASSLLGDHLLQHQIRNKRWLHHQKNRLRLYSYNSSVEVGSSLYTKCPFRPDTGFIDQWRP